MNGWMDGWGIMLRTINSTNHNRGGAKGYLRGAFVHLGGALRPSGMVGPHSYLCKFCFFQQSFKILVFPLAFNLQCKKSVTFSCCV